MTSTIEISRKLRLAGIDPKHADAIVEGQAEMLAGEAATKADLLEMRFAIETRIQGMETGLAILKWMVGVVVVGVSSLILKTFF